MNRRLAAGLFFLVLAHRAIVFFLHREALAGLLAANPGWLLEQYLPIELLEARPLAALLHLQQSPPLPNLLLAILLQVFAWPGEVIFALIALQALVSAATTAILALVVARCVRSRRVGLALGAILGLAFALDPDVLLLEYNAFGQHIYESLTMLLVLAAGASFQRAAETDNRRWSAALGVAVALAALTRASYSLLFPVAFLALLLPRFAARRRHLLAFAVPVLLLHGGWSLKQWIVFGEPQILTSTWGGGNLAAGLGEAGRGDELVAFLRAHPEPYPEWFVAMHEEGLTSQWFNDPSYLAHVPESWREEDRRILGRLVGPQSENAPALTNAIANTPSKARLYALYAELWRHWASRHPLPALRHSLRAYDVYWLPIRCHARQFLGLFSTNWIVHPRMPPWEIAKAFHDGRLPETIEITSGSFPEIDRRPVRLPVATSANLVIWQANLWIVHLGTPLAVLFVLRRWLRRNCRPSPRELTLLFLVLVYAYSAGIHNLAEYGENMRFRLTLEPSIWWMSVLTVSILTDRPSAL